MDAKQLNNSLALSQQQCDRIDVWAKKHAAEDHAGQREPRGDIKYSMLKYIIHPTTVGPDIKVECSYCKKSIDVSEDDGGEFLLDDDGNELWKTK